MKPKIITKKNVQPTIITITVFGLLIFCTVSFLKYKQGLWLKDVRADLLHSMVGKKSQLEKALYSRIYYTRGVAAYVSLNPGITNDEFTVLAREYIGHDTVISSMALSKNCVLNAIYPYKGHEAAIGLDLLAHPERKTIVEKTIETQQTFVAGPVELVEGGIAFISYTPIFDKTIPGTNFWGVADIVIKEKGLLNDAGLRDSMDGFLFALRGYNGSGRSGAVFFGDDRIFEQDPVTVSIELPIGSWELAAVPEKGWDQYSNPDRTLMVVLILSSFVISVLVWLFAQAMVQIKINGKELNAVFKSLDSLIIEFSSKGDYVKIASENNDLLYKPKERLEGKNIYKVFDKKIADLFMNAINQCIATRQLVIIEYPLQINERELWFMARVSYKSENSIIFNAYDITEKKRREERLQESERKQKELNETKNKFFSIIAHDLRGPLGSQKAVIDLFHEEYSNLDDAARMQMLSSLQESSSHLYNLLENLLKWALAQSGKIDVKPQVFNLCTQYCDILAPFQQDAKRKGIRFVNNLEEDATVKADVNLTEFILRNLISNSIKFTDTGGKVEVNSKQVLIYGEVYREINVIDTGIGMTKEKMAALFKLDQTQSTPGTANEKGNGLGLLLCKEFLEMQGTKLSILSEEGIGSTFSFLLKRG